MNYLQKLVSDYIHQMQVMSFVTVKDNKPWVASVHYAYDAKGNLYWLSLRNTRHSQELRENKCTAAAILIDPDKKQCIDMTGEAFELTGAASKKAHKIYGARYGQKEERLIEALSNEFDARAYYIFRPTSVCLFDMKTFPENPRQEYNV